MNMFIPSISILISLFPNTLDRILPILTPDQIQLIKSLILDQSLNSYTNHKQVNILGLVIQDPKIDLE